MTGEGRGHGFEGAAAGEGEFVVGGQWRIPKFNVIANKEVPEVTEGEVCLGRDDVKRQRLLSLIMQRGGEAPLAHGLETRQG